MYEDKESEQTRYHYVACFAHDQPASHHRRAGAPKKSSECAWLVAATVTEKCTVDVVLKNQPRLLYTVVVGGTTPIGLPKKVARSL